MFGLDWCVVVVIWDGVDSYNISHENEMVWVLFGFQSLGRLNDEQPASR